MNKTGPQKDLTIIQMSNSRDTRSHKLNVTCRMQSWFEKVGCDMR